MENNSFSAKFKEIINGFVLQFNEPTRFSIISASYFDNIIIVQNNFDANYKKNADLGISAYNAFGINLPSINYKQVNKPQCCCCFQKVCTRNSCFSGDNIKTVINYYEG